MIEQLEVEDFTTIAGSRFAFRISKVQQEALNKATGHLPEPSKQLELVNQKRKNKRTRAYHACTWFFCINQLKVAI